MAQYEILKFFKDRPNELYTSKDLGIRFDIGRGRVTQSLRCIMRYFPVFKYSLGNKTYYVYSQETKTALNKRGKKDITNHTTMNKI